MPQPIATPLPAITLESTSNAIAAVIWLHGLGVVGNASARLVPDIDLTVSSVADGVLRTCSQTVFGSAERAAAL
jgi:hypothetical protein